MTAHLVTYRSKKWHTQCSRDDKVSCSLCRIHLNQFSSCLFLTKGSELFHWPNFSATKAAVVSDVSHSCQTPNILRNINYRAFCLLWADSLKPTEIKAVKSRSANRVKTLNRISRALIVTKPWGFLTQQIKTGKRCTWQVFTLFLLIYVKEKKKNLECSGPDVWSYTVIMTQNVVHSLKIKTHDQEAEQ